jgi:hypothetical protein
MEHLIGLSLQQLLTWCRSALQHIIQLTAQSLLSMALADSAEPAEYGPALCWASFQIDQDQLPPPISGTLFDQINYLDNLDLDWELEDQE